LDTSSIPEDLRPFLVLYLEAIFELPILRDGEVIPHEEIVAQLERETVSYSSTAGFYGSTFSAKGFSQYVVINIKSPVSLYSKSIQWLKEILWQTQFTAERLKVEVKKITNDISYFKRNGNFVNSSAHNDLLFDKKNSNQGAMNFVRQQSFLSATLKKLKKKSTSSGVVSEMEKFRKILCDPKNLRIQVVADFFKVSQPKKKWENFLPKDIPVEKDNLSLLPPIKYSTSKLKPEAIKGGNVILFNIF